jgi:hypothetical protein
VGRRPVVKYFLLEATINYSDGRKEMKVWAFNQDLGAVCIVIEELIKAGHAVHCSLFLSDIKGDKRLMANMSFNCFTLGPLYTPLWYEFFGESYPKPTMPIPQEWYKQDFYVPAPSPEHYKSASTNFKNMFLKTEGRWT